jgi:ribonuclease E
LTVIDVNSGSFTRSATARETVLWTNCEAATEIARQLRLRNIGGVIIIDFIDMDSRRDQLQVLEHFNKALKADKSRPQIAQLSELGLVELTRKRQGQNLYELFGQTCTTCGGLGHLVRLPGEAEQHSLVAAAVVSSRPVSRRASSPNPWELEETASSFAPATLPPDIYAEEENENVELVNHPTYLERTNPKERRRGNRRGRREELEATPTGGGFAATEPLPSRPRPGLQLRLSKPEEPPLVEEAVTGEEDLTSRERHRPGRGKKSIESLEAIAIEMTQAEQEVYAMMGISPLVKLDREIKNPKAVQLAVILPGEAIPVPVEPEPPEEILPVPKPERTREIFSLEDFTPILEPPTKVVKQMELLATPESVSESLPILPTPLLADPSPDPKPVADLLNTIISTLEVTPEVMEPEAMTLPAIADPDPVESIPEPPVERPPNYRRRRSASSEDSSS